jgi:Glycosyl transferase family 2
VNVRPALSVIVPAVNGEAPLVETLQALESAGASGPPLEVIVLNRCGDALGSAVSARFAGVTVVPVASGTSIPRMRAVGFTLATAPAVGVIEDHVIVPPDWPRRMLAGLEAGADVVGGAVINGATDRTVDWAAFLCEYSHMMPPLPAGPGGPITGNNVVYRRSVLEAFASTAAEGRWEDHLHAAMRSGGVRLVCHPEIVVVHKRHYSIREYASERYLYARSFAGLRYQSLTAPARLFVAAGTLALPVVLLYRIVSRLVVRRRHLSHLARALPLLALFVLAWAAGEAVGCLAGPGDALARVT